MPSLPPELADLVEQLRTRLVEINGSEQTCITKCRDQRTSGKSFTEVQGDSCTRGMLPRATSGRATSAKWRVRLRDT